MAPFPCRLLAVAQLLLVLLAVQWLVQAAAQAGAPSSEAEAEASSEGVGGGGIQGYRPAAAVYRQQMFKNATQLPLHLIKLPHGFTISLYTNQSVPPARSMALSGASNASVTIVYVGSDETGENGNVHALVDHRSDGIADQVCRLLTNQDTPNGVAWHNGSLYVMETTRLTRYDDIDAAVLRGCDIRQAPSTVLASNFPSQLDHAARYIDIGPDGKLYVGVGAPSNIVNCAMLNGVQQCSIMRMNLDGSRQEVYAYGVRNTVGFAWHPLTRALYFGFLERDWQGASEAGPQGWTAQSNNQPDDYLCAAPEADLHFGYPYCHWVGYGPPTLRSLGPGFALADSTLFPPAAEPALAQADGARAAPGSLEYNATLDLLCEETSPPPIQTLGPHVAVLGVKFYDVPNVPGIKKTSIFPAPYLNNGTVLLAEHGSWNREQAIGYRIAIVQVAPDGRPLSHQVFASGWLQGEGTPSQSFWGRPSGLLVLPDGSLLVSDDAADAVYRISYRG